MIVVFGVHRCTAWKALVILAITFNGISLAVVLYLWHNPRVLDSAIRGIFSPELDPTPSNQGTFIHLASGTRVCGMRAWGALRHVFLSSDLLRDTIVLFG